MKEHGHNLPHSRLANPWFFFFVVFCWTWLFWLWAAVSGTTIATAKGKTLLYFGLLGPMVCAISLTYLTGGREDRRDYWQRLVDVKRIPVRWYPAVLLFAPALMTVAVLLDTALGGSGTVGEVGKRMAPFLSAPLTIVPFAFGVFMRGPFPEESGWRGYVLDCLQSRHNALASSLILGIIWSLWHLPLFFMQGMPHSAHGLWSPWFWQFMAAVVPMAVMLGWIYSNTSRSTLAAILFHFSANLSYVLGNVTPGTNLYSTLLWIIAAIVVATLWGPGTLTHRGRHSYNHRK